MGLMKKLTSAIVASSLVFSLVGSAFAAYTPANGQTACDRMTALNVLKGKTAEDPCALKDEITRAELVTIIVRAFGKEADAALLKGAAAFPDTASHWASGNIAMAKNLVEKAGGDAIGMPDGTFNPDGKLTPAQAVAFLMKFLGVKADTTKSWPASFLDKAVELGIITSADNQVITEIQNDNATRGLVFYVLDNAFYSYKFADGKTFYTKYVDPTAPELTLDNAAVSTTTEAKVTVTGTVKDAAELYVGSEKVTADASGKFSADFALAELKEYEIAVTAKDIAGGSTVKSIKVTRTTGEAVAISAPASIEVVAGESVDVAAAVKDAKDQAIAGTAIAGTSDLGTYADGKFTAGEKAGTGTLTLTSGALTANVNVTVKAGALAKVNVSPATVELNAGTTQKFTATGADAFGNEVALTSGVTWTATKGVMGNDGTYGATADAAGVVTVTATVGGISGTSSVSVFGTPAKVQIAAPATLVADNDSEVELTATVLDANGNVARNFNGTVTFTSSASTIATVETASVEAINGVATTTLKSGTKSGNTVLSASAEGLTGTTVTYSVSAQTLTSITMTVDPGTIAAKTSSYGAVKFTLVDQNGKKLTKMPSGISSLKVKVTTSDNDIVTVAGQTTKEYTLAATETTFTDVQGVRGTSKIGSATLTGVVTSPSSQTGLAVSTASVSTLIVGEGYAVTVDSIADKKANETVKVTFRVVDFNGNQLTTTAGNLATNEYDVEIYKDGDKITAPVGMITESVATYGRGSFTINWSKYAPSTGNAGTYTVKVKPVSATELDSAENTAVVTPADASKLTVSASPKVIAANGNATSKLTIKVKDPYNNLVTDGSYDVKVTRTGSKVTNASAEQTLTTSAGVAQMTVTATTKTGVDTFTVTNDDLNQAQATVTTAILGSPNKVVVVDSDSDTNGWQGYSGTAGEEFEIDVAVADANDITLTYDQGTAVSIEIFNGSTSLGTFSGTTENGVATIPVTLTKATAAGKYFKVVATSTGLTKDEVASAVTVAANDAVALDVASDVDVMATSTTSNNSDAAITVTLKDAYGNTAKASSTTTVYVRVADDTYGDFTDGTAVVAGDYEGYRSKDIAANGTNASFNFRATKKAGTIAIEAVSADLTEGSLTIESKIAGSIDDVVIASVDEDSDVADVTALANSGYQKITVNVVDGAGVRLTTDNTTEVLFTVKDANGAAIAFDAGGVATGAHVGKYKLAVQDAAGDWVPYVTTAGSESNVVMKGQLVFGILSEVADTLDYSVVVDEDGDAVADVGELMKDSSEGTFVPGDADHVIVVVSDPFVIKGNNASVTGVTAWVVDEFGNKVNDYSGTMTFKIVKGSDYASLQDTTAAITNGEATVLAKAKSTTDDGSVWVKAATDLNEDGVLTDGTDGTDDEWYVPDTTDTAEAALEVRYEVVPKILSSVYTDVDESTDVSDDDTIVITFERATNAPALEAADFVLTGGHSFGADATFEWDAEGKVLTITMAGTGLNFATTDDVNFAAGVNLEDDVYGDSFDVNTDLY